MSTVCPITENPVTKFDAVGVARGEKFNISPFKISLQPTLQVPASITNRCFISIQIFVVGSKIHTRLCILYLILVHSLDQFLSLPSEWSE